MRITLWQWSKKGHDGQELLLAARFDAFSLSRGVVRRGENIFFADGKVHLIPSISFGFSSENCRTGPNVVIE